VLTNCVLKWQGNGLVICVPFGGEKKKKKKKKLSKAHSPH